MSTQRLFFVRFAIPALPFLSLLAGYAASRLGSQPSGPLWRRAMLFVALASALAQTSALSLQHNALLDREDTRALATLWIEDNLPTDATLAAESDSRIQSPFGWKGHQMRATSVFLPEDEEHASEVLSGKFDYVIVSSFGYESWDLAIKPSSRLPRVYRSLHETGQLVALLGPGPGNSEMPYAVDDAYTPFWHLDGRERPGPTVRIYKVRDVP